METIAWIVFHIIIIAALWVDLRLSKKKDPSSRQDYLLSGGWIILAIVFGLVFFLPSESHSFFDYFTGYFLEKTLSLDNLIVMALILSMLNIPHEFHHRVLVYGIAGAIILRLIFILCGLKLLAHFHAVLYLFGAFLVFSAISLMFSKENKNEPKHSKFINLLKKFIPISKNIESGRFFIKKGGKRFATPLFVALFLIEITDVIFAIDSIPAIFAITEDPLIVYTSNIFAVMGLRSLHTILSKKLMALPYIKSGLALILLFVGIKILVAPWYQIPNSLSLGSIVFILFFYLVAYPYIKKKRLI